MQKKMTHGLKLTYMLDYAGVNSRLATSHIDKKNTHQTLCLTQIYYLYGRK